MDSALVDQFMEITSCQSQAYAVQQLSSCRWNLERAINLFFNSGGDVAAGPSDVAVPSPSVAAEEGEVRGPIPARVEKLYDDSYYDGSHGTARAVPSIWDPPSPKPVPAVPIQGLCMSDIQASGWGEAEPEFGGNGSDADVVKVKGSQQDAYDNVLGDDDGSNGLRGMGSDEELDDVDKEGVDEEQEHNVFDEEDEEQRYNVSECGGEEADSDYQMGEDDAYDALVVEEDHNTYDDTDAEGGEEQPRPTSLAEMYQPPHELMYHGTFHGAKVHAARQDRFLLVNLQTRSEFASCLQNRDLWPDKAVSQVVQYSFVLFLLEKLNEHDDEGSKVCSFYKLEDGHLPAVLVLDPITGQMLSMMSGAMQPDEFMLFADEYTKSKPSEKSRPKIVQKTAALPESSASTGAGGEQEPAMPDGSASTEAGGEQEQEPVPMVEESPAETVEPDDEPMEGEKMYKLRVRFPDGSVVPKEFGCKRRVSKLFAFCRSAVHDAGKTEQIRVMRLNGRAFEELQDDGATFEDLGLNCATVSVVFVT